jgi:hypothetical protein
MTWINNATPSGFGGFVCLFAATFISPLRGDSLFGMPATSAPLGGVQALNVFLIDQHVTIYILHSRFSDIIGFALSTLMTAMLAICNCIK